MERKSTQPFYSKGAKIIGCHAEGNRIGIGDAGDDGTIVLGCTMVENTTYGFHVMDDSRNGLVADCQITYNAGEGVHFDTTSNTGNYRVRGNKIGRNATRDIFLDGNVASLPEFLITDNDIWANGGHGVFMDGSTSGLIRNLKLAGNCIFNNGQAGTDTYGVRIDANLNGATITDNRITDTQGVKTQTTGIRLSTSASFSFTDCLIADNNLAGNSAAGLSRGSIVFTRVNVRNNISYVTEDTGTATITDTTSSVTVTHGLASTPTSVTVTARGHEAVWVSARKTTFTGRG